jgi:hypothetical protein
MSSRPERRSRPPAPPINNNNNNNNNALPPIDLRQFFPLGSVNFQQEQQRQLQQQRQQQQQQQQQVNVLLGLQQQQQQLVLQAYLGQTSQQQQQPQQQQIQPPQLSQDGFALPPVPHNPNETMRLSAGATLGGGQVQGLRRASLTRGAEGRPQQQQHAPNFPSDRQLCFLFVKILLKYTERTDDHTLRSRAKAVVAECTHRNRLGDTAYMPLQEAVERRLRRSLGEVHWARAKRCFDVYCSRQGILAPPSAAAALEATSITVL